MTPHSATCVGMNAIHERKEGASEGGGRDATVLAHRAALQAHSSVFGISEHDLLYSKDDAEALDAAVAGAAAAAAASVAYCDPSTAVLTPKTNKGKTATTGGKSSKKKG